MSEILSKIAMYWQFPFVRNAIVVGMLIAMCSSLLGVTLVLKRFSFIGDGLSHAAFGAMCIASVLHLTNNMPFVLAATVVCAVVLLKSARNSSVNGDAALAMLSSGSLAVGYLLMNVFSGTSNLSGDVCATLFGSTSILTLSSMDVWLSVMLSVITAIVIVLSMNLAGSLLVSALIVFPALSAMRVCASFLGVTLCSVLLSVSCALVGMLIAILVGTPVGATIVAVDMSAFGIFCVLGDLRK